MTYLPYFLGAIAIINLAGFWALKNELLNVGTQINNTLGFIYRKVEEIDQKLYRIEEKKLND
jgi:hypothetical protein